MVSCFDVLASFVEVRAGLIYLPASDTRLNEIRSELKKDERYIASLITTSSRSSLLS